MPRKNVKNMSRDQQKAVFYKMSQIHGKNAHRSPHSRAVDRGITARNVYTGRDTHGKSKWMKHPNQVDMKNVDTRVAKEKYKSKKSKESMKQQRKDLGKTHNNIQKTEEKKKRLEQAKKDLHEEKLRGEKISDDLERFDHKRGETDTVYWKRINDEKTKELEREEKLIHEDIEKQRKEQKQKEEELKKTEVEHVTRKKLINDTRHGKGYNVLSESQIDQIERLTPQQKEELVKDVEQWYNHRENATSLTPEEKQEIDRINTKYKVQGGLGAYYGITGKYPRGPRNKSSSYQRSRPADQHSSPAERELDNTVKLSKLKTSINSTETKYGKVKGTEADLEREKKYYKQEKEKLDKTPEMKQTSTDVKDVKKRELDVEDADHKLFMEKRSYEKYVTNQKKTISTLKSDPNVSINTRSTEGDVNNPTSDVILEYKGDYVQSKKVIPSVNNEVIRELNL